MAEWWVSDARISETPRAYPAAFENPLLDLYGLEFAHRIAIARRRAPRFVRLPGTTTFR
ncbi:hypothetical protein [Mesorhizobium delmotii]|uniref:Esterase/lipase/thioesterase n=1 Tax=Mesorhizobium delmotii TaxID=1631247 RepID=A0A2P9ABB3_9HYPH